MAAVFFVSRDFHLPFFIGADSMKRSLGALGLFLSGAFASGCPLYSDNVGRLECVYATDCALGYRCAGGVCVLAPPHTTPLDGGRDVGPDVALDGELGDGAPPDGATGDGSGDGALDAARPDVGFDGGPLVYCGNPGDCAANETCSSDGTCRAGSCPAVACINQFQCATTSAGATCVRGNVKGCSSDRHCGSAERCIDGTCTPFADLCTDRSQCGAGRVCADGRCVDACTSDADCDPGFPCRTTLGLCSTANTKSCMWTRQCGGGKDEVCVGDGCVPRCQVSGACGTGSNVCVDNGCVPSTKVVVECDPATGPTCAVGKICVHRHCYAPCGGEGGSCDPQSSTPVCHTITDRGQTFAVCGAAGMLGSECDPTIGKACDGAKTCVDGYCK
jgi:hypothetical protein